MTSNDELGRLLAAARQWRGQRMGLATVVRTWGSAPRRAGAHLLMRDDGLFEGSVSGGCVEGAVMEALARRMETGGGELLHFGVADETAWEVGLACGGEIEVLVQAVDQSGFPPDLFDRLAAARARRETLTLATDLSNACTAEGHVGDFLRRYDPPLRLMLVGAVHIAQALVPMAGSLGYRALVVDPRTRFASAARFPSVEVDTSWPDEALAAWKPDGASAVVALTHDPKLDDPALEAALRSPAFYVAALGSRKTHASRRERLAARGFSEADLGRIHGPAGLAIGAANPAEIALSVAAEMVQAWRSR
jgi:xanthine dehydrogenase accessory factor